MRIQNIQMSNNTPVNFKASVSEQVKYQLYSQLSKGPDKKKTTKLLEQQIENISKWGSDDSEIVIAKDYRGKYRIGLPEMLCNGYDGLFTLYAEFWVK